MKEHGVPEQNVSFSSQESFLFEASRLAGNPIMVALRRGVCGCTQVRLRIFIEFRKPFRSMGSRAINEWTAVGSDIFACNPAPDQETTRLHMEYRHVLMQG